MLQRSSSSHQYLRCHTHTDPLIYITHTKRSISTFLLKKNITAMILQLCWFFFFIMLEEFTESGSELIKLTYVLHALWFGLCVDMIVDDTLDESITTGDGDVDLRDWQRILVQWALTSITDRKHPAWTIHCDVTKSCTWVGVGHLHGWNGNSFYNNQYSSERYILHVWLVKTL